MTNFDDPASQPHMDSQPRIKGQTLFRFPGNVIIHAGQWIFALLTWANRDDQMLEAFGFRDSAHSLNHRHAQPLTSIIGTNDHLDGAVMIWG